MQRATVYRHFPDEEAIFQACTAHWASLNPPPDHTAWADIRDPSERLRAALTEIYDWYGWAEPMLSRTTRDAPVVPAMQPTVALIAQLGVARRDVLLRPAAPSEGRPVSGSPPPSRTPSRSRPTAHSSSSRGSPRPRRSP